MEDKNMQIEVMSRQQVEQFVTDLPHIVINAIDPGSPKITLPNNMKRFAQLSLEFSDIDGERFNYIYPHTIKKFTKEDAQAILQLIKLTEPYINLIIVNCEAGICRSSAIAAALSVILHLEDGDKKYFNPRGPFHPNMFVYRTILNTAQEEGWNYAR